MQKEVNAGKTALITGASGGIGLELARLFAADKIHVVLVARSADKLEQIAAELQAAHSIDATVLPADLSLSAAPQQIYDHTKQRGIAIDYLVNNAGFGIREKFVKTSLKDILEMVQLNISALTHLTRLYLAHMLERNSGRILNVSSTAAYQPGPGMSVYYATKAYVSSFSEALSYELRETGVTVTALCPGPTWTGFQERAGAKNSSLMKSKTLKPMDAATVARAGYQAMRNGKRVVIPGVMNRIVAKGAMIGPRRIVTAMAGSLNDSKK